MNLSFSIGFILNLNSNPILTQRMITITTPYHRPFPNVSQLINSDIRPEYINFCRDTYVTGEVEEEMQDRFCLRCPVTSISSSHEETHQEESEGRGHLIDTTFVDKMFPSDQNEHVMKQVNRFRLTEEDNFRRDIIKLKELLRIPDILISNHLRVSGTEGLCILLRRMAYPNRYVDLMKIFGRSRPSLSRIFRLMVTLLINTHGHRLDGLNHNYLTMDKVQDYANAIELKGSPYTRCFAFIDGTVRPICRPTINQKEFYNGHKRTHALKFQSIVTPDGIIASLFGPIAGRRHDAYLLQKSRIIPELEHRFYDRLGQPFHLYGDPAYPLLPHLIVGFRKHELNPARRKCNKLMSQVRECVEWEFGRIAKTFAFVDFKKNLKMQLQPVGNFYLVAALLANCHSCLYKNQTSDYFELEPPTLEEYLS